MFKPDNWTNPDWDCHDYNCTWFHDDLDMCYVSNCTNNYTWEQWCKVNWTTSYEHVFNDDCDNFFQSEDQFDWDPREEDGWSCYDSECWWDDPIPGCQQNYCYESGYPYGYWC